MTKNITITSNKNHNTDIVSGTTTFALPKKDLWKNLNHPNKLAPHCINLNHFFTDETLKVGNKIEEIHSFAGWKQRYTGVVKSQIEGKEWSMVTYPVGFGPFPLPHYVKYSFEEISENESSLSITCEYKAGGLLSLPIARTIVRKIMEKAVSKLLVVPNN